MIQPYRQRQMRPYARAAYTVGGLATTGKIAWNAAKYAAEKALQYNKRRSSKKTRYTKTVQPSKMSKSKVYTKPRPPNDRTKNKLKRKVNKLARQVSNNTGTLVYKRLSSDRCVSSVNQCNYLNFSSNDIAKIEGIIDGLLYFNPSLPGTLTTVDATSGTYHKEVEIASTYSKLVCRNNYQAPCEVIVYCVVPREDTSVNAQTTMTNGFTDIGSGISGTSIMMYPSDSPQFKRSYKIVSTVKKELAPGQTLSSTFSGPSFQYDPANVDAHSLSYQRVYNSHQYLIRVQGICGHDISADEQGYLAAGVDITLREQVVVKYPAGIDLHRVEHVTALDTFTNGGVYSAKPVVDNIGYSIS